jgi:hypothetical protein
MILRGDFGQKPSNTFMVKKLQQLMVPIIKRLILIRLIKKRRIQFLLIADSY